MVAAHGVYGDLNHGKFANLFGGYFQNFAFPVKAAMGACTMRKPLLVAIRALG
jgi:hypothetical protein